MEKVIEKNPDYVSTQQVMKLFDITEPFFRKACERYGVKRYYLAGRKIVYKYDELVEKLIGIDSVSKRGNNQYGDVITDVKPAAKKPRAKKVTANG